MPPRRPFGAEPAHQASTVQIDALSRGRKAAFGNAAARVNPGHAMPPSAMACNLWTQELHANSVQARVSRPEIEDASQFAPIGVAFRLAEENGRGAVF